MLVVGVLINAVGIILGVISGLIWQRDVYAKHQEVVNKILAAFLIYVALRIVWVEMQPGIISLLTKAFLTWCCLAASTIIFKKSQLPRWIAERNRLAQQRFSELTLEKKKTNPWQVSFLIGTSFFCITPLTFAAAALMGVYGDVRIFVIKSVIDSLGVHVFTRTLGISALSITIPTAGLQLVLIYLFATVAQMPANITMGLPCVGLCVAYLCLHSSLVMLGWNKAGTLFSYVPALFLALLLEMIL